MDFLTEKDKRIIEYVRLLDEKDIRIARLEAHIRVLLENDPDDDAADAVSVLDVWRKEARALLRAGGGER